MSLLASSASSKARRSSRVELSASDPFFNQTVLLAEWEGVDGATTAVDHSNSAHTLSFQGNAQIDDGVPIFALPTSLLLDNVGDWVNLAPDDDWIFGTGDFCMEIWQRHTSQAANDTFFGWGTYIFYFNAGGGVLVYDGSSNIIVLSPSDVATSLNTERYFCLQRYDGELYVFGNDVNGDPTDAYKLGIGAGSGGAHTFNHTSNTFRIGESLTNLGPYHGNIGACRITKAARYPDAQLVLPAYTVPTLPLPKS